MTTQPRERPILFSAPMVRAILAGTKTQTRRAIKPQPTFRDVENLFHCWVFPRKEGGAAGLLWPNARERILALCPYGRVGDRLWVREAHAPVIGQDGGVIAVDYRATYQHGDRLGDHIGMRKRWTPAIHMRRDHSRITLEITEVRAERLQEISDDDCCAEGVDGPMCASFVGKPPGISGNCERCGFASLWESINGAGSWDANPWVWAISFKRVHP